MQLCERILSAQAYDFVRVSFTQHALCMPSLVGFVGYENGNNKDQLNEGMQSMPVETDPLTSSNALHFNFVSMNRDSFQIQFATIPWSKVLIRDV